MRKPSMSVFICKEFVDMRVVDEEVEGAAVVGEVFGDGGEGLIVAGVAAEIRAADDAVADFELHEWLGDLRPLLASAANWY